MKKLIFAIALVLTACGNKTGKTVSEADTITTDSIAADSTTATGVDKHAEAYILQRLDAIYSDIRQRVVNSSDENPYIGSDFNLDSAYCSSFYYGLLKQALEIADKTNDVVLEYDHWICGQDFSNDWDYQIQKVYDITDSTALADIIVINFGNKHDLTLSLLFERGDWYINEFGPEDAEETDKAYFRRFISDGLKTLEKAKASAAESR